MTTLTRALPLVALALVTLACDSLPPTAPAANRLLVADREHEWTHKVSGHGKDLYPGDVGATFAIRFKARGDESDSASGSVDWRFLDGTPASYGTVYCLEVRGNRAYMAYRAEGGSFGGYGTPGYTVLLGFTDNDGGPGPHVDGQTYIYYTNGYPVPCKGFADFIDAGGPGGGFPVGWVKGEIEVR